MKALGIWQNKKTIHTSTTATFLATNRPKVDASQILEHMEQGITLNRKNEPYSF